MGYAGPYEMMQDVEDHQCVTCIYRKNPDVEGRHAEDYPMCYEVEGAVAVEEDVVPPLDMRSDGVVVCTKYREGPPLLPVDPDQLVLGES